MNAKPASIVELAAPGFDARLQRERVPDDYNSGDDAGNDADAESAPVPAEEADAPASDPPSSSSSVVAALAAALMIAAADGHVRPGL